MPVQVLDPLPAPQSGYHSSGTPAAPPPPPVGADPPQPRAVKAHNALSGGSQSTVSQSSMPQGADSGQPANAHSQPAHKRSKLGNQSEIGRDNPSAEPSREKEAASKPGAIGWGAALLADNQPAAAKTAKAIVEAVKQKGAPAVTLDANTLLQSSGGKGETVAPVSTAAAKSVPKQTVPATEQGSEVAGASTPIPAPPPGSPTASSKTQEVVPPPPPAIPLPPSLMSPSSSRTLPAATTSPVPAISQLQPHNATPSSPASAVPLNQVRQQRPQHERSPRLHRPPQQQQQQPSPRSAQQQQQLPAKANAAGATGTKQGASSVSGSGTAQRVQVTHMEQQHPPQVQLPVHAAPRQQQQQHHQNQQLHGQQQQRSIAQLQQGAPQQDRQNVARQDGLQQSFRQGQLLAMYPGQHEAMLQAQGPHPGHLHHAHPPAHPTHPAHMPQWLQTQGNPGSVPHMQAVAQGHGPNGAQGMLGMHAHHMHPAQNLHQTGPSPFAQAHFGFQPQPFQPGMLNASRQQVPSNMQPGWFTPTFLQ